MLHNLLCDRDGTIIYDRHYLSEPGGIELLPGAASGLLRLQRAGMGLFIVTNQSGIGRGILSIEAYKACEKRLSEILQHAGVQVKDSIFCPHAPTEGQASCSCRKPDVGMWDELQNRHGLNSAESVMIGDKPADIMFGKNIGCAYTILVLSGKGKASAGSYCLPDIPVGHSFLKLPPGDSEKPDCVALNLDGAADFLLAESGLCQISS